MERKLIFCSYLFLFYIFLLLLLHLFFCKFRGSELNLAVWSTICYQRGSGYWWYVAAVADRSLVNSDTLRHDNERCMIKLHQCHQYIWPWPTQRGAAGYNDCCVTSLQSLTVETRAHSTRSTNMFYKESEGTNSLQITLILCTSR